MNKQPQDTSSSNNQTTEQVRLNQNPTKSTAAGGWPALGSVVNSLKQQAIWLKGSQTLLQANQPEGFDCPGCAWPDPQHTSSFEFCENGAKAVAWEATAHRADRNFFAQYSVTQLRAQSDHWLEAQGRLTEPLRYNAQTDHYEPISWEDACYEIGSRLRALPHPNRAEFYTSGRTSNEAAFLYQLLVRLYGTNNFPDCSNLCHEASSVGLRQQIGIGKGTVTLEDFEHCDLIISIGHNPGTNHPRMLATLQRAVQRGARVAVFNPLRERGLERFTNPQNVRQMATNASTPTSTDYFRVKIGGDIALLKGLMKCVLAANAIDNTFISTHTHDFSALQTDLAQTEWAEIESISGLARSEIERAAQLYIQAERVILCYGMGITQHVRGTETVQQLMNLLLLRGQIGKPGAGICPLRGHSNVQGDRTMGIDHHPSETFLQALEQELTSLGLTNIQLPRAPGHTVIQALQAMQRDEVDALITLGGNFAAATPDPQHVSQLLPRLQLTVGIHTKLNRFHVLPGQTAYILPCLGRTELDQQATGAQAISVEDSMSMVHASRGSNPPASPHLRSEPWIIAQLAQATLPQHPLPWQAWVANYDLIRDMIARVLPACADYNTRLRQPGGFRLPNSASQREWRNAAGKALFVVATGVQPTLHQPTQPRATPAGHTPSTQAALTLTTIRSHDQYNTTIYSPRDRYRGDHQTRQVLFMNVQDMQARGLQHGSPITIQHAGDQQRTLHHFTALAYDIPSGNCAAYYPEANPLMPLDCFDPHSTTPAFKSVPVVVHCANKIIST